MIAISSIFCSFKCHNTIHISHFIERVMAASIQHSVSKCYHSKNRFAPVFDHQIMCLCHVITMYMSIAMVTPAFFHSLFCSRLYWENSKRQLWSKNGEKEQKINIFFKLENIFFKKFILIILARVQSFNIASNSKRKLRIVYEIWAWEKVHSLWKLCKNELYTILFVQYAHSKP